MKKSDQKNQNIFETIKSSLFENNYLLNKKFSFLDSFGFFIFTFFSGVISNFVNLLLITYTSFRYDFYFLSLMSENAKIFPGIQRNLFNSFLSITNTYLLFFIFCIWFCIFLFIARKLNSISETITLLGYSSFFYLILGMIPFLNIFAIILSICLVTRNIKIKTQINLFILLVILSLSLLLTLITSIQINNFTDDLVVMIFLK